MEKYEQLKIDYDEEKKEALKTEERHDKLRQRVEDQEEFVKQTQKDLARVEMENDELKNDVRQMGFMVDDLE
jgi:septal ring factor EnvC (AmiA/AmiB activator)